MVMSSPMNGTPAPADPPAFSLTSDVIVDGELLRFGFDGDIRKQAELVSWIVGHGFAVAEVNMHKKSLEDVFLQVTEGLVQ